MKGRSSLAPVRFPNIAAVAGVTLAGTHTGLKAQGNDLMLAHCVPGTTVAGVLTRTLCPSAPVDWCRKALTGGRGQILVANSGNANAFTGQLGQAAVADTVTTAAHLFGCPRRQVFIASTGVIGELMPAGHISGNLPQLAAELTETGWQRAAEAIMTTDTFAKGCTRRAKIGDVEVTISGIAKGSGMIAPDLGTMFAFVFTDARAPAELLRGYLRRAVDKSFNCVTVDGDTSTSDTVLLFATGQAKRHPHLEGANSRDFKRALDEVCINLARQLARDGEGAEKFITINVTGAVSVRAARRIGLSIANSPLVKTAVAGSDPNWGRIVMAVGKAGEKADRDRLTIAIGGIPIAERGRVRSDYNEGPVAAHMRGRDIIIDVDIGLGRGRATVWTCDLTHAYIDLNADYRT